MEANRGVSLSELKASGMGLYVVSQVADRWGADSTNGATVWAEFDIGPRGLA